MKKTDKIFCSICLTILLFFFCMIVMRIFTRQILVKQFGMNNAFTDLVFFDARYLNDGEKASEAEMDDGAEEISAQVKIDWAEIYPFSEEYCAQSEEDTPRSDTVSETVQTDTDMEKKEDDGTSVFSTARQAVTERVKRYEDFWRWNLEEKVNDYASDYLIGYLAMTEWAKQYEDMMRWNYVPYSEYNGIIETSDGYLTAVTSKRDMQEYADAAVRLYDFCTSEGSKFLYINAPVKICRITDSDISGVSDFSHQNADDFLSLLNSERVPCYDLRIPLHEEGHDHHAMYFRTDNHWHPETGLWAAGKIVSVLNADYGFKIDPSYVNEDRYTAEVYPEWFLGAQGKKVTLAHADPEDFTLLYPTFDTLVHYEVKSRNVDADGDFSVFYDMNCVTEKNYYRKDPYAAYIYANQALERIENRLVDNGYHVLVVHDSYGNCVVPFLAMGIQYVDSIDLRFFDGSLQTFIEREHPDCVIVLYNAEMYGLTNSNAVAVFDLR